MILIARYILASIFITVPLVVDAATDRDWGIGLYVDQDLAFPFLNEDRDYTMGLGMEFFWQNKDEGIYILDGTAKRIGEWLGLHAERDRIVRSFMLGSVSYTPNNLTDTAPIPDDRPYASLLYLSNKRVRANPDTAIGIELQAGILGTQLAETTQKWLHGFWRKMRDDNEPVDPQGWSHQVSDDGEPTARLRLSYSKLLLKHKRGVFDLATNTTLSLGYQTNVSLGASARMGNINSDFWSLPFDPINRGNFLPSLHGDEWYLWSAYRARLIGYDALLQGQFRESNLTFKPDQIKRIVHEGAIGLTLAYEPLQLTFAVNGKSPELGSISETRNHYWGSIYLIIRH